MQYLVIGHDGTDEDALPRRLRARQAHLARADELAASGNLLYAAAILDQDERMVGSVLVVEFAGRDEVDGWLRGEPYVTGDVWRQVSVQPCRVSPIFAKR